MTVVGARKASLEGLRIPIRIRVEEEGRADRDGGVKVETAESCGEREEVLYVRVARGRGLLCSALTA